MIIYQHIRLFLFLLKIIIFFFCYQRLEISDYGYNSLAQDHISLFLPNNKKVRELEKKENS